VRQIRHAGGRHHCGQILTIQTGLDAQPLQKSPRTTRKNHGAEQHGRVRAQRRDGIDDVEASRDKLAQISGQVGASASAADRARIKRALRDLAELPRISVTFDGVPPAHRFWLRSSPWVWLFVLFGVLPAVVMFALFVFQPSARWWNSYWYLLPVVLVAIAFLFCWGLFAFTGVASDRKLNRMIGCSYMLTFFILVASILPFANQAIFDH
jgi:hypothetical protein